MQEPVSHGDSPSRLSLSCALCRSEDSFMQYLSEMPWVAVPYADKARRSRLNRLYGIQGSCRLTAALV